MARKIGTLTGRPQVGVIAGYMFKLIRESASLSQEKLAEMLGVDRNTIQGWESGRRPLTGTNVAGYTRLQGKLRNLGADTQLLTFLPQAVEADQLLEAILFQDYPSPDEHPLASWGVMNRSRTEFLLWPLTQQAPAVLGTYLAVPRRGPVAPGPVLSRSDGRAFFQRLQEAADRATADALDEQHLLLRRQAYYLAASDQDAETSRWLTEAQHAEHHRLDHRDQWSPAWVARRSLLVARARCGDREPLQHFIATALAEQDELEAANLNYWASWAGETGSIEAADTFMASPDLGTWRGAALLARLTDGLVPDNACVDLYAHSIWALLQRRGHLLVQEPQLVLHLGRQVENALDSHGLSVQVRREIESVAYAIRVARSFSPSRT